LALTTAFVDAQNRTPFTTVVPADLTGRTLAAGVYRGGALSLTGALTLDAHGDAGAIFIFQAASTLITGPGSRVNLINGASSCNVFWQVGSSATLNTSSVFRGTIMAHQDINLKAGATVDGRVLAQIGQVTLITNTIRRLPCVVGATVTPTATPTPQATQAPTGAVASGDGSTSGGTNDSQGFLAGAMLFAGVGGAAVVAVRRRRRLNA